ncbi:hypothetical protein [Ferruginibacter profundus]
MYLLPYIFLVLLIVLVIYLQSGNQSDFQYDTEAIYIGPKKIKISYRNMVAIARDVTRYYRNGSVRYYCYIITAIDADNKTRYIPFFKNSLESEKWEGLKQQITETNPQVIIDESLL